MRWGYVRTLKARQSIRPGGGDLQHGGRIHRRTPCRPGPSQTEAADTTGRRRRDAGPAESSRGQAGSCGCAVTPSIRTIALLRLVHLDPRPGYRPDVARRRRTATGHSSGSPASRCGAPDRRRTRAAPPDPVVAQQRTLPRSRSAWPTAPAADGARDGDAQASSACASARAASPWASCHWALSGWWLTASKRCSVSPPVRARSGASSAKLGVAGLVAVERGIGDQHLQARLASGARPSRASHQAAPMPRRSTTPGRRWNSCGTARSSSPRARRGRSSAKRSGLAGLRISTSPRMPRPIQPCQVASGCSGSAVLRCRACRTAPASAAAEPEPWRHAGRVQKAQVERAAHQRHLLRRSDRPRAAAAALPRRAPAGTSAWRCGSPCRTIAVSRSVSRSAPRAPAPARCAAIRRKPKLVGERPAAGAGRERGRCSCSACCGSPRRPAARASAATRQRHQVACAASVSAALDGDARDRQAPACASPRRRWCSARWSATASARCCQRARICASQRSGPRRGQAHALAQFATPQLQRLGGQLDVEVPLPPSCRGMRGRSGRGRSACALSARSRRCVTNSGSGRSTSRRCRRSSNRARRRLAVSPSGQTAQQAIPAAQWAAAVAAGPSGSPGAWHKGHGALRHVPQRTSGSPSRCSVTWRPSLRVGAARETTESRCVAPFCADGLRHRNPPGAKPRWTRFSRRQARR